ncbi:MAG: hypothetical protein AVDCRST_MAG19-13 [uncultured Thermomicrobiales bacterium]|uniref:YvlB/LiaX N-terminal domain-containing protein n=1 Tax=uncultured Thermomicrobiales bacterium TaxID=1645740 RepID=A0A6J4U9V7_9BACT|nr:MAG: hypothetical protein AVDCRST_MAG19-13 [uncultured Thermomicrobiales bacterium]
MTETVPPRANRRDPGREDRIEILRLLESGTVTADEAAALLDALDQADRRAPPDADAPVARSTGRSPTGQVRIRVTESETGQVTVNVAVPLALVESGLDIASQFVGEYLPAAKVIRESVATGLRGSLVDVDDGEQRLEIIVE